MFSIVTRICSRGGTIVRKGHFAPRVPVRSAGAALVAAGIAASGVMAGGPAAATTRPAPHRNPPPAYARTLTVTRLGNAGPGSLRAAITSANTSLPGRPVLIRFAVRGTITLSSALPAVARNTTINGATAPGYRHGAPVVEIDANGQAGLEFAPGSSGSRLLGLAVDDASGDGVTLEASNDHAQRQLHRPQPVRCRVRQPRGRGLRLGVVVREHDRREPDRQVRGGRRT